MLKAVKTYIDEGTVYYGLEIYSLSGTLHYHLLELKSKKQELFIVNEETFDHLEGIPQHLKKNAPLFLVVNTDSVLTKIIASDTSQTNPEALVNSAFPNLDFSVFYFEVATKGTNTIISICKKEVVQGYLKKVSDLKLNAIALTLGITSAVTLASYVSVLNLYTTVQTLAVQNKTIQNTHLRVPEGDSLVLSQDINGLKVSHSSLLGFASILKHILKSNHPAINFEPTLLALKNDFINRRRFNLLLKTSLISVLSLLLINFFIFNYYYRKVESLKLTSAVNSSNKSRLAKLKTVVKEREERVNAILSAVDSKTSFYLDEIGSSVPKTILLNGIQYQPLLRPMRDGKVIALGENILIVSGKVRNGSDFSIWIEDLEQLFWVRSVETQKYDYANQNTSNFTLKINIHE